MLLCTNCEEFVKPIYKNKNKTFSIQGVKVEVELEEPYCSECNECLVDESIEEKNNQIIRDKYFEITNIIRNEDIKEKILDKYNISAKNLAKLLGWGEVTVQRYVSGALPSSDYGQTLKLLINPLEFEKLIHERKSAITEKLFKKAYKALDTYMLELNQEKKLKTISAVDVVKYLIKEKNFDDIYAPKIWFMKLVAFIQGWHLHFFGTPLYMENALAWEYGPVVYEILCKNEFWDNNTHLPTEELINLASNSNIDLNADQIELIDKVYEGYSCYQPFKLVDISHDSLYEKYYSGENSFDNVIPKWAIKENYDRMSSYASMNKIEELPYKIKEIVNLRS